MSLWLNAYKNMIKRTVSNLEEADLRGSADNLVNIKETVAVLKGFQTELDKMTAENIDLKRQINDHQVENKLLLKQFNDLKEKLQGAM